MEPDDFVDERGTPAGDKQQHNADPREKRTTALYRPGIQIHRLDGLLASGIREVQPARLLRCKNTHDSPALHRRVLLQLGHFAQFLHDPIDDFVPFVDVGILAAAENDREYDLVFIPKKLLGPIDLGHQVVVADFGAQPQLFIFAVVRMAFVLPLFLLVFELTEVHDPADGRLLGRGDLDQIEPGGTGLLQCLVGADDSQLGSVVSDDADR
jgi:hypothetical protein